MSTIFLSMCEVILPDRHGYQLAAPTITQINDALSSNIYLHIPNESTVMVL